MEINLLRSGWKWRTLGAALGLQLLLAGSAQAQTATLTVQVDKPGIQISSNLFGLFFEEISSAGDGGLYAELVRNRSFEESASKPEFWTFLTGGSGKGEMAVDMTFPLNPQNPRALKLTHSGGVGSVGAVNNGFWGIPLQQGETYHLSFYVRSSVGFNWPITVSLESANGNAVYAYAPVEVGGTSWRQVSVSLRPTVTDPKARLVLRIAQSGSVWVDMVSLFPGNTFNHRTNGLRLDLANLLKEIKPAFLRFPGGCYVEGDYLTNAFRWKDTLGNPAARPGHRNGVWNYSSTDGLGYHEYLQLCEDLGAEPLFVINCGMAHKDTVPLDQMSSWVQDALDAIEYANGPTNTTWGSQRAANGHAEPFNLKFMEIGNENGGPAYNERYALFHDAIKAKYSDVQLIACLWGGVPNSRPVEMIDEHYYANPMFFINNATRYDGYNRKGPKIYVGEYAVTSGSGNGNLRGALGEAAFMTGLERNADIVTMASYAPLFANVNNKNWNPDLIYYDSSRVAVTPSYHVQKMFAENRGDIVLPASVQVDMPGDAQQAHQGSIGLGSWNTQVEYTNVVVTQNGHTLYRSDFNSGAAGWEVRGGNWIATNGVYQQTMLLPDCRSTTGNTNWSDYTIRVRARKIRGEEGFLVSFNARDAANYTWWNIGGWKNTQHGIELAENGSKTTLGSTVAGEIETNRWYDIRVELGGCKVRCYLDDRLVHEICYPPARAGAIGLGSWNTRVSFTNLVVTKAGQKLYQSDFTSGAADWKSPSGSWSVGNGIYRQTATAPDCRSITGDTNWSDYTLHLRARRDSGSEGFLVLFHWLDNEDYTWWNIGGWNNSRHALEVTRGGFKSALGDPVNGSLQTGVWYDIRVEVSGSRVRCYLNDQLIHDVGYPMAPSLVVSSSYAKAREEIVVKAVNVSDYPITTTVNLAGLARVSSKATLQTLTSISSTDENTLDQPLKVVPTTSAITVSGTNFVQVFPANSLSILRLQTASESEKP
jgi:alpha-L-arabinofuranosidase